MTAYYNEIDPFAVAWLRALIAEGVIADGIVDDRSIEIVQPEDLVGFTQCHFFAGIGVWSYALRRAGWPDDRPVWTGSCPCQPFSAAGKEEGFADPRHLWPAWFRLARFHQPDTIFGEQVERAIRSHWLDLVSTDLEREGYAVGSTVFGSHSVGAPHQRQRLYFVADRLARRVSDADSERRTRVDSLLWAEDGRWIGAEAFSEVAGRRPARGLSDSDGMGRGRRRSGEEGAEPRAVERSERLRDVSDAVAMGDATGGRRRVGGNASQSTDSGHVDGAVIVSGIHDTASPRRHAAVEGSEVETRDETRLRGPEGGRAIGGSASVADGLHDAVGARLERHDGYVDHWDQPRRLRTFAAGSTTPTGILSGFWDGAEWVECTDGKARPVEPGSFPLAYGSPARVGRLRGYGNAINAEAAKAFIEAYREVKGEL